MKKFLLFAAILLLVLLSGCVNQSNAAELAKAVPEAREFLEQNPGAEIKALFFSEETVKFTISSIREECGQEMKEVPYWLISMKKDSKELKVYTDEKGAKVKCIVKPGVVANQQNGTGGESCSSDQECSDNNPATKDKCNATTKKCTNTGCIGNAGTAQCSVQNGNGTRAASCVGGEWVFDGTQCNPVSCYVGYQLNQSTKRCEKACDGNSTAKCSVYHGIGQKTRSCDNGEWEPWGECGSVICDSGYEWHSFGKYCVEKTLICDGNSTESCFIANGTGKKTRNCVEGQWTAWGDCNAFSCDQNYSKSGNSCIPSVP